MAKNVIRYDLLVSSPNDIVEEREIVTQVIDELNLTICSERGMVLTPLRWETHGFPNVGEDPQAVLNKQFGDKYDIFLGILCKRFGTPTGRADSGTEEEFRRAYERHKKNAQEIRIMFYFRIPDTAPTLEELDQFRKVLEFKKSLGKLGALYWEYKDSNEFKDLVRVHLARQIATLGGGDRGDSSVASRSGTSSKHEASDEDAGLFELIEYGVHEFAKGAEITSELTTSMEEMNSSLNDAVAKMDYLKNADPAVAQTEARRLADNVGQAILTYSEKLEQRTSTTAEHHRAGLQAMARVVAIAGDFGPSGIDQIRQFPSILRKFRDSIKGTRETLSEVGAKVLKIPRATTSLTRARTRFSGATKSFEEELRAVERLAEELEKSVAIVVGQ